MGAVPAPMEPTLRLFYQDEHLVVCEKPVGLLSEQAAAESLPAALARQLGGTAADYRPVHRLDRVVGGVALYARSQRAAAALGAANAARQIQKEYWAVLPAPPQPAAGQLQDYLFKDGRAGKAYPVKGPRRGAKQAVLAYETLAIAPQGQTLLRVTLETGRFHQIRCQFASRRLPLLGDGKYGSREKGCTVALWCHSLGFAHPVTGEALRFAAPPPPQFPWSLFALSALPNP